MFKKKKKVVFLSFRMTSLMKEIQKARKRLAFDLYINILSSQFKRRGSTLEEIGTWLLEILSISHSGVIISQSSPQACISLLSLYLR